MPVRYPNYNYRYKLKDKPVFAPSDLGRRIGLDIKEKIENAYNFDNFFYHLRQGGHVAALHTHRQYQYFCKLDITNFFYSVSRHRISRCLNSIGIARKNHYARWSVVKNPFDNGPDFVLPYGFVQSPILATLVMAKSELANTIRQLPENINATVYVDDILLSSNDITALTESYEVVRTAIINSNFQINATKSIAPINQILAFNCDMQHGITDVKKERIDEFYSLSRSKASVEGFERYLDSVRRGNH